MNIKNMNRWRYRSDLFTRRALSVPVVKQTIARLYHLLFWHNADTTWRDTRWLGVDVHKLPLDLWVYQEILFELKPDVIIETGTCSGGSAYYFASIFDLLDHGRIVTIDIDEYPGLPEHPRITYLRGSSSDPDLIQNIAAGINDDETVMVVLDSDHSAAHVSKELELLAPLVSVGSYLVVEDGAVRWLPVRSPAGKIIEWDRGPSAAAARFLERHSEFEADPSREKYFVTENPGSWLRRTR